MPLATHVFVGGRGAARQAAAVVPDEVARAEARADRVDAGVEAVAAGHELPLRRLEGRVGERVRREADDARRIVLRAARRRRARRRREVAADVARVVLDRVEAEVGVEPRRPQRVQRRRVRVQRAVHAAVVAGEQHARIARHERERVLVDVHRLRVRAGVAARRVVPRSCRSVSRARPRTCRRRCGRRCSGRPRCPGRTSSAGSRRRSSSTCPDPCWGRSSARRPASRP